MRVIAKLVRIIGVDQLHVGTVVGKMSETKEDAIENCNALKSDLCGLRKVLPVASGGLHPGLVPSLFKIFGRDFVIQAGGGIHGHEDGTFAGAKAMRQAVEAVVNGIPIQEYAESHEELKKSLKTWR
jgi:ribulose-bisphosphate carboxylase large chain